MNQNIWGPHTWFALHSISFAYPLYPTSQDKERYKTFINTLQYVLPCSVCRKNFRRNLKEFPPKLSSRKSCTVCWQPPYQTREGPEKGYHP